MSQSSPRTAPESRVLIWARPERGAKGPAPSKSREQIARAAVDLADTDGLEAASMRKVASSLGIGAASLYSYVLSKDELTDLMVDLVEGEDGPPPALTGQWRTDMHRHAWRFRALILRHPWLASVAAGRPTFGPNALAWAEHGLAALDPLDLEVDELLVANDLLVAFVRGFTAREIAEHQALRRNGLTPAQWAEAVTPYIERIVAEGKYPRFARVVREAEIPHAPDSLELLFRSGLDRLLDVMAVAGQAESA